jgi:hypothetical protein
VKPSLKSVSAVAATVMATSHIGSADNYCAVAIRGDGADTTAGAANQCDALDARSWRKGSERHRGCGSCRGKAAECSKSNKCQFEFHGFLPCSGTWHSKEFKVNKG